jgi:hypothetical protein
LEVEHFSYGRQLDREWRRLMKGMKPKQAIKA